MNKCLCADRNDENDYDDNDVVSVEIACICASAAFFLHFDAVHSKCMSVNESEWVYYVILPTTL